MQRDAIKPPFQRTRKRDSLLPSVVVLPKIGAGRGEETNKNNGFYSDLVGVDRMMGAADGKSAIALPPTPAKTSLVERQKIERKQKKEQDITKSYQAGDGAAKYLPTAYDNHGSFGGKFSGIMKENALFENGKGNSDDTKAEDTFENPSTKELWHYGRNREPGLIRRESCCSSCGGALSYTNSFASTRRFSAVSIEVPNENLMKKSFTSRNTSVVSGDSLRNIGNSFTTGRKAETRKLIKTRNDSVVSKAQYDKIERQKNLLYDLLSVLYKKNFIKEEVRPYVQHALKICNNDAPKNGRS